MGVKKRSVTIRGHQTSFALEDEFWAELNTIAQSENLSLARLVTKIDAQRKEANLSSAIRLFILKHLKNRVG